VASCTATNASYLSAFYLDSSGASIAPVGGGGAVLLRALAPLDGLEVMWPRRPKARRERDLCSGPARLTQALGLTGDLDGTDLSTGPVLLLDDGTPPPADPGNSVRIGLSPGKGDKSAWRWWVPGDPNVSRPPPRGTGVGNSRPR